MPDWKKKLKFISITAAFAVLILIVLTNIFKMTQVSEKDFKTYRQGLTYLNQKDYENAYFNFSNVAKNSAIYEIALLRQGMCADDLKDHETAVKKYRMFIEKYPDSIFIQKVYYALAQNYFREKDYPKAEKTFVEIKRNFKENEYKTASNYYLGIIYKEQITQEKDKAKAKNSFIEYLKDAPDGRFAMTCVKEIEELKMPLSQADNYLIGQTYFKNGQYKPAFDSFNKSYMHSSWGYLSLIYQKTGERKKANEIFENGYSKYSTAVKQDELYDFIEAFASAYPQGIKSGLNKALEISRNNNAKGEDYILYRLSKYEDKSARTFLYNEIYTKYPNGKFASDALANLFWQAYINGNYQEALKLGQIHLRDYQNTLASPKVMFWMGKITDQLGNKNEAKGFYQKLLAKYPDDYYAYRASKKLSHTSTNWKTKSAHRLPETPQSIRFPFNHTNISDDNISLINSILKLNDFSLLTDIEKDNKAVQSWIKYKEGKYGTSALLARDALADYETKPAFSDSLYKLAYQLHYQEAINDNAREFGLDPLLVTALIREESYFNSQVTSSAGALGLMQLMPSTASYIASRNGIRDASASSLLNPEKNIKLGCAYLNYAKERLYNDDMLAVASYNGGPNAVRNWKDTLSYKNFDEFIENIPYLETRDYVKKVYRSYWVYLNVY